jgi:hypothetical protein
VQNWLFEKPIKVSNIYMALARSVYLSGERQRPADPEAVSLRLDGRCRQRFVDQPEAGDGITGSALIIQQAGETRRSAQLPRQKFNRI